MCRKLTYSLCIALMLGMVLTSVAKAADPNLVGCWRFDEGAGTVAADSSGYGNDGTLNGAPEWVASRLGGALDFDGSADFVEVPHSPSLSITDEITIAAWTYMRASASGEMAIVSKGGWAANDLPYELTETPGDVIFWQFYDDGGRDSCAPSSPPVDEWHHIAGTYDGKVFKCYIDGELAEEWGYVGKMPENTASVTIGRRSRGGTFFNGMIDEVQIYNRALTAAEIKQLIPPQLKAYEPDPADGAKGVTAPLVRWTAGDTAAFHDVYFGTNPTPGPAEFKIRQTWAVYWGGSLTPGTTYYWRIDEVEADGVTIYTGDVWSFTAAPLTAYDPVPRDGAKWVATDADLSWTAGATGVKHDVYFGTDQAAVANGTGGTLKASQQATKTYDPGAMAQDTTYYWRIDEYDSGGTKYPGTVWSFTTIGASAGIRGYYFNNMNVTGAPVLVRIDPTINFNWGDPGSPDPKVNVDQFSARWVGIVEALYSEPYTFVCNTDDGFRMWLDDELIIDSWVDQAPTTHSSAPINLVAGQRYGVRVEYYENGGGAVAQLFWQSPSTPTQIIPAGALQLPLTAGNPSPPNGAVDVKHTPTLRWSVGEKAVKHNVYLGTDAAAVANATTASAGIYRGQQNLAANSYVPSEAPLAWNKTYYWRIDEVNGVDLWKGSVWSFTTANFVVVDDFEDYTDDVGNRIFQTWRDGYGFSEPAPGYPGNGTGSAVGYAQPPFAEQTTVHGGSQSMPLGYDNSGTGGKARYSETQREWTSTLDWTKYSLKALTLYFYGAPANAAEQLYVALEDNAGHVKVVNHPDPEAVQGGAWQEWNIELTQFSGAGVNLKAIKKMYIGLGNRTSPKAGGTGTIYIDDIRVYSSRCVPSIDKPAASFNNDCVVDHLDLQIMVGDWLVRDVPEPAWDGAFSSQDIGAGTAAGSFSFDGNVYTIEADGADIWGTADAFHYAYKQVSGDFQMTVRVTRLDPVDVWSKAGVMVRQSLDPGSANAMIATSGSSGGGATFQWRPTQGASSSSQRLLESAYAVTEPACIRLVRQGSTISGYVFVDGRWQLEGQTTAVVLTGPVYIGLAVTSHVDGTLTTAMFDRACVFSASDLRVDGIVDFKDYAVLADSWLEEILWP